MVINRVYIIYTVYYIILYIYPIFIQTHVLRFFRGSPVRSPESRTGALWRLGWHHLRKFTTSRAHASSWTATGFGGSRRPWWWIRIKLLQLYVDNMFAILLLDNSLELVSRISRFFRGRFKHVFLGMMIPCVWLSFRSAAETNDVLYSGCSSLSPLCVQ